MWLNGEGGPRDPDVGRSWLVRAAEAGHVTAAQGLASFERE